MTDNTMMANLTKIRKEGNGGTPVAVNPRVPAILFSLNELKCLIYETCE